MEATSTIITSATLLPSLASKKIQAIIIEKDMKCGDKMPNEQELMVLFGVGRSTIREAVKLLTAENVLEIKRGKGTFVKSRSGLKKDPLGLDFTNQKKLLQNLMETRLMIEPEIAMLATKRATSENIAKLKKNLQDMRYTQKKGKDYSKHDVAFHVTMAECTQNDVLHRIIPIICESIRGGYLETINVPGSFQNAVQSHFEILAAIKEGDSDKAYNVAKRHILETMKDADL